LFAQEGAKLIVNDLGCAGDGRQAGEDVDPSVADELAQEIVSGGGQAISSTHDVSSANGAADLVALALSQFGQVDVLVNNAGVLRDKTFLKLSEEDFDAVLGINLRGSFLCSQAAARSMVARGGSIINTTSVAGLLGNYGQTNDSAAKAGVYGLTRASSIELQRYGIRVNAVAPLAKTRLTAGLPMFESVETMTPAHVAPVHLYLASDLSRETSGTVIGVAGGRLSVFRLVESPGKFKDEDAGVWSAQEIAEHFRAR
jgi:NAD(P)-dependent dehydrogenase (short-subunit alcohol dehydrogenase family)